MAAGNQQAKKVAWLESMLDTSIVAYESHRNALENIYAQLAQWQHPPNTGCIHISPEEVQELLRDINDVLDQCALQLQPFHADAATPPPQEQPKENGAAKPEPDSRASSRRDVSHTPSIRSPTQDHPAQPEQQQQPPPASSAAQSNAASKTPSTYGKDDRKPASVRTASDAPSRATHASAANAQQPPQQQHHPQQPKNGEHTRTASATPSQASSVPPSTAYNAEAPAAPPAEAPAAPPAEAPSDRHSVHSHPRQRAADSQAPSEHSVRSSVPPPRGEVKERAAQRPRQPADATTTTTTAKAPLQGGPAQAAEAPRPRMQTCHHHRRVAGLALTPWPILNDGKDDAAAVGGQRTPSATARAEATKEELPAEQYNSYKEHGVPRATSMERRAAAAALERRAKAVEEAKENAVYLPPDDQVAERAAAAVRARQPAPTSSPSESQRSQPPPQQQQQQQQQARPTGSSARAGPASTAPSSVGGASQKQHDPRQQQPHSQCEQSLSAAGEEGDVDGNSTNDAIPRRRGTSAASESASDAGSSAFPAFSDDGNNINNNSREPPQRSTSQHSRRSQPHQKQQQQQQQHQQPAPSHHTLLMSGSRTPSQVGSVAPSSANAQNNENGVTSTPHQQQQPRTVTSSRASSAVGPRSASGGPQQQQQQQQQQPSAVPPVQRQLNTDAAAAHPAQMDASQVGSVGLVYTPSVTPQRDSTREGATAAAAAATQRPPQQQPPQQRQEEPYQPVPGAHRPLRTAVPRRTTPRAYDSTQSEDAIFHGRLRNSPHRPPVRADSPHSLRYMEREDAQLKQRKEEELAEIQQDPRLAQQIAGHNGGMLKITDGSAPAGVGEGAVTAKGKGQQPRMTALEEQLIAERTALHNQLEKMQMEVTIATGRNKEWGNERRYSQVNGRMTRVLEDLDRVEKELRTVRNLDREARLGSAAQAR